MFFNLTTVHREQRGKFIKGKEIIANKVAEGYQVCINCRFPDSSIHRHLIRALCNGSDRSLGSIHQRPQIQPTAISKGP